MTDVAESNLCQRCLHEGRHTEVEPGRLLCPDCCKAENLAYHNAQAEARSSEAPDRGLCPACGGVAYASDSRCLVCGASLPWSPALPRPKRLALVSRLWVRSLAVLFGVAVLGAAVYGLSVARKTDPRQQVLEAFRDLDTALSEGVNYRGYRQSLLRTKQQVTQAMHDVPSDQLTSEFWTEVSAAVNDYESASEIWAERLKSPTRPSMDGDPAIEAAWAAAGSHVATARKAR
ncbi:hypothetical protein LLH03_06300 [bacterium]|nr:hypothetical protein [bacterium]